MRRGRKGERERGSCFLFIYYLVWWSYEERVFTGPVRMWHC